MLLSRIDVSLFPFLSKSNEKMSSGKDKKINKKLSGLDKERHCLFWHVFPDLTIKNPGHQVKFEFR